MTSRTGVPKENLKQLQAEVVAGLKPVAAGKPEPGQTPPTTALRGADLRRQSPDDA